MPGGAVVAADHLADGGPGRGRRRPRWRRAGRRRSAVLVVLPASVGCAALLFGPPLVLHGTGEAAAPGAGGIAVLRAVLFAALCVPVGTEYARWLARRVPGAPAGRLPAGPAGPAAAAGFLAALGLACVVSAGNLIPHRLADLDAAGLYRNRAGVLALVEVNAFLLAMLAARARHAVTRLVPPAAIVAAEALRAHPATEHTPLLGSALTAIHLACAVLWVGGLWQVLRTVRMWGASSEMPAAASESSEPGTWTGGGPAARGAAGGGSGSGLGSVTGGGSGLGDATSGTTGGATGGATGGRRRGDDEGSAAGVALLVAYAWRAAVLLAVLTLTGVVSAVRRMPPSTVLGQLVTTAYGRTLLAKLCLVAVAAVLALLARRRLGDVLTRFRAPRRLLDTGRRTNRNPDHRTDHRTNRNPDHRTDHHPDHRIAQPARAEAAVLGAVVAVSALLTALPVPIRW